MLLWAKVVTHAVWLLSRKLDIRGSCVGWPWGWGTPALLCWGLLPGSGSPLLGAAPPLPAPLGLSPCCNLCFLRLPGVSEKQADKSGWKAG